MICVLFYISYIIVRAIYLPQIFIVILVFIDLLYIYSLICFVFLVCMDWNDRSKIYMCVCVLNTLDCDIAKLSKNYVFQKMGLLFRKMYKEMIFVETTTKKKEIYINVNIVYNRAICNSEYVHIMDISFIITLKVKISELTMFKLKVDI